MICETWHSFKLNFLGTHTDLTTRTTPLSCYLSLPVICACHRRCRWFHRVKARCARRACSSALTCGDELASACDKHRRRKDYNDARISPRLRAAPNPRASYLVWSGRDTDRPHVAAAPAHQVRLPGLRTRAADRYARTATRAP